MLLLLLLLLLGLGFMWLGFIIIRFHVVFGMEFFIKVFWGFPFHLFGNLPFTILHLWKVYIIWALVLPRGYLLLT